MSLVLANLKVKQYPLIIHLFKLFIVQLVLCFKFVFYPNLTSFSFHFLMRPKATHVSISIILGNAFFF